MTATSAFSCITQGFPRYYTNHVKSVLHSNTLTKYDTMSLQRISLRCYLSLTPEQSVNTCFAARKTDKCLIATTGPIHSEQLWEMISFWDRVILIIIIHRKSRFEATPELVAFGPLRIWEEFWVVRFVKYSQYGDVFNLIGMEIGSNINGGETIAIRAWLREKRDGPINYKENGFIGLQESW
jgi:hypothetical protein